MWKSLKIPLLAGAGALAAWKMGRLIIEQRRSISFQNRVVLITGGSRGLGLVMARRFAAEGANLALCARNADELERAVDGLRNNGAHVVPFVCDVTQPNQIAELTAGVRHQLGPIDVLVNNAGVIQVGPANTMTEKDIQNALAIHLWAPYHMINAVLPDMRTRGSGRIVNIASVGGELSIPHLLPYCISKFALVGYSRGLYAPLAKEDIYVTTICPGLMRTGSHLHAQFKGEHQSEFAWFSVSGALPGFTMSAERAARQIIESCRLGKSHLTLSLPAKAGVAIDAIAPELMSDILRSLSIASYGGIVSNQAAKGNGLDVGVVTLLDDSP